MTSRKTTDLTGLWSLFWRCFIFLPYMLAVFLVVGTIWSLRLLLPLRVLVQIYQGDFWPAAATFTVWLLCLWLYRRFNIAKYFESPPSLL